jgi:hypothetical protein
MGGACCSKEISYIQDIIRSNSRNEIINLGHSQDTIRKLKDNRFLFEDLFNLNSISYALLQEQINSVQGLLELGLTGEDIFNSLIINEFDPLRYFSSENRKEGLKYYLGLYLDPKTNLSRLKQGRETYIQTCVRFGMLENLKIIRNYFKHQDKIIPQELSFDSKGAFGENCVLYACRYGQKVLLQYFWENLDLKSQFSDENDEHLGAIELCILGYDFFQNECYYKCLEFLVKTARVCPRYSKETLIKLSEKSYIERLESLITKNGFGFPECNSTNSFELSKNWIQYSKNHEELLKKKHKNSLDMNSLLIWSSRRSTSTRTISLS